MRTKILYLTVVASMFLTACKDYLELQPLDRVPANQLLSDINGVNTLLANLYNRMPMEDFNYDPTLGFNITQIQLAGQSPRGWTAGFSDEAHINVSGNNGPGTTYDYWTYSDIRQVNQFLKDIQQVNIDEATRNRMESEAHFVRAYIYFGICKRYGGVPLITTPQNLTDELSVPRSTEKETWDFILQECDLAIENLPLVLGSDEGIYRVNKWVAYALKSRIALYAASVAKYWNNAPLLGDAVAQKLVGGMTSSDANNYYLQCINVSKAIIDNSGKDLYKPNPANVAEATKNYQDMFQNPSVADIEVIFKKGYIDGSTPATSGQGHGTDYWFTTFQSRKHNVNHSRFNPTLDIVDAFEDYTDNGNGLSSPLVTRLDGVENVYLTSATAMDISMAYKHYANPIDIFANKDARLFASIILPGSSFTGIPIIIQGGLITQDGSKLFFAESSAVGQDGRTYYSYGAQSEGDYSGFKNQGGGAQEANYTYTGFSLRKFLVETSPIPGIGYNSKQAWIDFRLAEIYLNYAEAAIESGQGDAGLASTYLNAIRKRAGHTDQIPATIQNIRKEEQVEFIFEGHRYWDLMRTRQMHVLFNATKRKALVPILDLRQATPDYIFVRAFNYYDNLAGGIVFVPKSYYLAIPGVSTSGLVQNPEY